jgi:formimidoylglutamate deiminase
VGAWADLCLLDHPDLAGRRGDAVLDTWIFAQRSSAVTDLWSAGRHIVTGGRHRAAGTITPRFRAVMARLTDAL